MTHPDHDASPEAAEEKKQRKPPRSAAELLKAAEEELQRLRLRAEAEAKRDAEKMRKKRTRGLILLGEALTLSCARSADGLARAVSVLIPLLDEKHRKLAEDILVAEVERIRGERETPMQPATTRPRDDSAASA